MRLFIVAVLLLFAWLIPLHFPPWVSWHLEALAFFAAIAGFGCLLMYIRRQHVRCVEIPLATWPFALLTVVVILQYQTGQITFGGDAFVLVMYFVLCVASVCIGRYAGLIAVSNSVDIRPGIFTPPQLAGLILFGGLLSAIVAFVQATGVWESATWIVRMPSLRRPGGALGQPNQLATFLLFSIASLIYLWETKRVGGGVAQLLAAVLLLALSITESRSGALGLLMMTAWWMAKRGQIAFTLPVKAVGLWFGFFALCFWFWPTCFNYIQDGGWTESTVEQVNTHAGTRLIIWPQLWQAVLMHPWLGWGLREVSTAHNAVLDGYSTSEAFTYSHNIALDMAVGLGLPLSSFLLCVVCFWLYSRAKSVNNLATWYCMAVLVPFGVHSMLEFPFAYAYFLVPVMVLVGVLEVRLAPARLVVIPLRIATAVWLIVSIAMAWSVVEYMSIEEDFRIARFEAMRVGQTPGDYERPRIVILTQLDALLEGARVVPAPNMDANRIELSRKVALRFPWSATQNRYAMVLALNGNPEEAIRQLKVIRAMHGEKVYNDIRENWGAMAQSKYPQLSQFKMP